MSNLCQFPGMGRIRVSGKLREKLKMFLLLKENGGWEVNKAAALLTNPLFPCRVRCSTVDGGRGRERERESLRLF